MLFEIDPDAKRASSVQKIALADLGYRERWDLQEWILSNPTILGEDLFIITDEFARFDRTRERLDVLAIDRSGKLVVVELKRSAVGTHAELQAIRYAAYCSTLSLSDIAEIHSDFQRRKGQQVGAEAATDAILEFVSDPGFSDLDNKPRIILGAEEFPPEITASVMWLRDCDIDIRCIRLATHRIGNHVVLDASILIPLPEAEEFIIRRERKEARVSRGTSEPSNSAEVRALHQHIINGLQGEPGFPSKSPPRKATSLYYKNVGNNTFLGVIRKSDHLRVELYIDEGDAEYNRALLTALETNRAEIEQELGRELVWDASGNARKCAVFTTYPFAVGESVEDAAAWAADRLKSFRSAFVSRYDSAKAKAEAALEVGSRLEHEA